MCKCWNALLVLIMAVLIMAGRESGIFLTCLIILNKIEIYPFLTEITNIFSIN